LKDKTRQDIIVKNPRALDAPVSRGSWAGVALAFKAVADLYGWTHVVVVSDDETWTVCWYGVRPFDDVFGNDDNYATLLAKRLMRNDFVVVCFSDTIAEMTA